LEWVLHDSIKCGNSTTPASAMPLVLRKLRLSMRFWLMIDGSKIVKKINFAYFVLKKYHEFYQTY